MNKIGHFTAIGFGLLYQRLSIVDSNSKKKTPFNVNHGTCPYSVGIDPYREFGNKSLVNESGLRSTTYLIFKRLQDNWIRPAYADAEVQNIESSKKFNNYVVGLEISGDHAQNMGIHSLNDVDDMLKIISCNISRNHEQVSIYFDLGSCNESETKERLECFQRFASAESLQFSIGENYRGKRRIIVEPKLLENKNCSGGRIFRTYINGTTETFSYDKNGYENGTRTFLNGKKEQGKFCKASSSLISGYRLEVDRRVEFISPNPLASCSEDRFMIFEFEGDLVVLENTYDEDQKNKHIVVDIPLEDILFKSLQKPNPLRYVRGSEKSIANILSHRSFEKSRSQFIEYIIALDESGTSRLFGLLNKPAFDVLEAKSKIEKIDPLKIIDTISGQNFFIRAAYEGDEEFLENLARLFPESFKSAGQDIIAKFLSQGHSSRVAEKLAKELYKVGGVLDMYHHLWLQIALSTEPSTFFEMKFYLLSPSQKKTLYEAAFIYNNPFIYESPDIPVKANQYSVNLMWINNSKMPVNQKFLFGEGSTLRERELDFKKRFIEPISQWAKANSGSDINIWIDSEMATSEAINRSRELLTRSLEGNPHGMVHFRDVRCIEVVRSNSQVFSEKMPIYFRVDLLRAIVADHVLTNKETKFFVYGDIDMTPLSRKELFDKRTVNFLDDFGIVMKKGGWLGFENGFQILNGENRQLMDSHRKVIIDLNLEMALNHPRAIREQQIYDTYPAMITHFLDADGRYGKLNFSSEEIGDEDSKLKCFRFDRFKSRANRTLPLGEGTIDLKEVMPRKPVRLPPSHF
ncbi:MAG: hypothetical protein V4489_05500 [Chlamydiota bacterium]